MRRLFANIEPVIHSKCTPVGIASAKRFRWQSHLHLAVVRSALLAAQYGSRDLRDWSSCARIDQSGGRAPHRRPRPAPDQVMASFAEGGRVREGEDDLLSGPSHARGPREVGAAGQLIMLVRRAEWGNENQHCAPIAEAHRVLRELARTSVDEASPAAGRATRGKQPEPARAW